MELDQILDQNENFSSDDISASHLDGVTLVNRLTENVLRVRDSVDNKDYDYDFYHPDLTPTLQFWIKDCFVCRCGGWNNSTLQTLSARNSTAKQWKQALLRIGVWASYHYPSSPLSQWTESHVKELLLDVLDNKITWTQNTKKVPLNRSSVESVYLMLIQSRKLKLKGMLVDGLGFDFPKRYLQTSLEVKLESYKLSYDDWSKSDGWESIPLPIAMGLLHDAITLLRDKRTLFLRDYFKFQRSSLSISWHQIEIGTFNKYCKGVGPRRNRLNIFERVKGLKEVIEQHYEGKITGFPFSGSGSMNKHCEDVHDACIVIFLCLTGIRLSELKSVCADDYRRETDGIWTFDSELIKTNMGIVEVREMSGLVAEAAETLTDLSYIVKRNREDKERLPLFGRYFYGGDYNKHVNFRRKNRGATENSSRGRLNIVFGNFLERHPEFETLCPSINPHRFRHTWAEFALRRFEGNVFEAIRRHFRHSFGSYFTTHYVFDKLSDEVRDQLEKNYLVEILTKIATENIESAMDENFKRDLHGKAARHLSQAMGTSILTQEEIDDFIDEMADEYEGIVAHEYGYCLVRKATKHLAKCIDRKTQTPVFENGSFVTCSGCIHLVTSECSNKESITRIAVSHTNLIASMTDLMGENVKSKSLDVSKQTVKRAETILNEMEA
jgi:integrase